MISAAYIVFNLAKQFWNNNPPKLLPQEFDKVPLKSLVSYNGVVTRVKDYSYEINGSYVACDVLLKLKVGDKVVYERVGSAEGNSVKVIKKVEDASGNYRLETILQGEIVCIEEDRIVINPGTHNLSKHEVELKYIPQICDIVKLQKLNNIYMLYPESCKVETLKVIKWESNLQKGLLDNQVSFTIADCGNNYYPRIGDKVVCSFIPSKRQDSNWRCLVLVKWNPNYLLKNKLTIRMNTYCAIPFGQERRIQLNITNNTSSIINLIDIRIKTERNNVVIQQDDKSLSLLPGLLYDVKLHCSGDKLGITKATLEFVFENISCIYKRLVLFVYDQTLDNLPKNKLTLVDQPFRGAGLLHYKYNLPNYDVPEKLKRIVHEYEDVDHMYLINDLQNEVPIMEEGLNKSNYGVYFHTLLFLEELCEQNKLNQIEMLGTVKEVGNETYVCIYEDMPEYSSISVGDRAVLSYPWTEDFSESPIVKIVLKTENKLYFKFRDVFGIINNSMLFKIKFLKSRTVVKRLHLTIDNLLSKESNMKWLFPNNVQCPNKITKKNQIKNIISFWYNTSLNIEQRKIVEDIVFSRNTPKCPYIVFGPPGTGKTITIVELILQLIDRNKNCRILVGTPSNSAADIICSNLISYGANDNNFLIRLVSYAYICQGRLPVNLLQYAATLTATKDDALAHHDVRSLIHSQEITETKIICGTLANLVHLNALSLKCNITHVIIDEAGQTTEPHTIVPIALSLSNNCDPKIILVGDPHQLGPVIHSEIAKVYQLGQSYMERLMSLPFYSTIRLCVTPRESNVGTALTKNYRSCDEIVNLISQNFYYDKLEPMAENSVHLEIQRKFKLTSFGSSGAKIVFLDVHGTESHKKENMNSYFNKEEVGAVVTVLMQLYECGISESDVGVITPYLLQCKEITEELDELEIEHPKVGTVEEFQGSEKPIIILSLVRTKKANCNLSFISDNKRANVALSRAQVAIIIIGHYETLMRSNLWKWLLKSPYIVKHNINTC